MRDHKIFVDGNYTFRPHELGLNNKLIDYVKLVDVISGGDTEAKAIFYSCVEETPKSKQIDFLHMLRRNGFQVKTKKLAPRISDVVNNDLKPLIITDIMAAVMNGIKKITLVSGDQEYAYVLQKLVDMDVIIHVVGFEKSISPKLIDLSDFTLKIEDAGVYIDKKPTSEENPFLR